MTSQPNSDATIPLPDDENTADDRTVKLPAADRHDGEVTIVGPHAASEMGNAAPSDETHAAAVTTGTSADPETTLKQKIGGILEEFAQTLASEHQDLDQTLPHTSLKPVPSESGDRTAPLKSFTQTKSLRPRSVQSGERSVQSADQTGTVADGRPSAVSETPDDSSLDYLTLDKLGEGGMGTVHLAQQVALGREVALKQIHQRSSQEPSVRDEFLTEAVLTGKLEHPNIVPIYEVGESSGGELFYSMKNVKGCAWDETIDELTLDENLEILIDVCDAVAFAHAEGVILRDLKPQNIMIGRFGEVIVLDWGMAVVAEPGDDVIAKCGGTPSYMAPEMINPPFLVGPRSDVYLLGAILFRFLTGKAPHAGKSARSSLEAASKNEIDDAGLIQDQERTGAFLEVAMKAMATAPADRFQTAVEFQQAVRDVDLRRAARRQARIEKMKKVGIGLVASILVIISGATYAVNEQRKEAIAQKGIAEEQRGIAEEAKDVAIKAKDEAVKQKGIAEEQRGIAQKNFLEAEKQRKEADTQRIAAVKAKDAAVAAEKVAVEERKKADMQRMLAVKARDDAVKAQMAAELAQKKEAEERKKAEAARIAEAKAKDDAIKAKDAAVKAEMVAVTERKKAEAAAVAEAKAKTEAVKAKDLAVIAQKKAEAAAVAEAKAKTEAVKAKDLAVVAQKKAEAAAVAEKKAKEVEKLAYRKA